MMRVLKGEITPFTETNMYDKDFHMVKTYNTNQHLVIPDD